MRKDKDKTMNASVIKMKLTSLAVFRNLLEDPAINALVDLMESIDALEMIGADAEAMAAAAETEGADEDEVFFAQQEKESRRFAAEMAIQSYGEFCGALYKAGGDLSGHIKTLVMEDENAYVRMTAAGEKQGAAMSDAVAVELYNLQAAADLTSEEVQEAILSHLEEDSMISLPGWENTKCDLGFEYFERMKNIHKTGYGMYARYHAFTVKDGKLTPVRHPDPQTLDQLYGYERERELIIKNTEALLAGRGASNILLYGDAGTGKSSTVKAIVNEYAKDGLRLVEVRKEQLHMIPDIIEELSDSPLKFILFIDDLSFSKNDDNFSALKAILEGSISASGDNVAVYATSTRRHLVKESMKDRDGDELYANDALQEVGSLSARFGLTITYQNPKKDDYLAIVDELAKDAGFLGEDGIVTCPAGTMTLEEMHTKAMALTIRGNSRSPRTAKQFVELLGIGIVR